ncbi:MAG: hypothetical protein ACXWLM_08885, partial [Myxococcales bacterium]
MMPAHVADRHLEEDVRELDLLGQAADLLREAGGGHTARTLAKQGSLRVVLLALARGARIPQHRAAAAISVQALSGSVRFRVGAEERRLVPGRALVVAPGLEHDLEADE